MELVFCFTYQCIAESMPTTKKSFLPLSPVLLLLGVSVFLSVTGNVQFFEQTVAVYSVEQYWPFLISVSIVLLCAIMLSAAVFCLFLPVRVVSAIFLLIGSVAGYFSDNMGIIMDKDMIRNVFATDVHEAADLLNWGLIVRVVALGIIPTLLVFILPLKQSTMLMRQGKLAGAAALCVLVAGLSMLTFGNSYASYFREHKSIRYFTNPTIPIYSTVKLAINSTQGAVDTTYIQRLGSVSTPPDDITHDLVIVVVGETARADHFGLNGYERQTTPMLANRKNIVSFANASSCGTATAISVPCMFSLDGRKEFKINQSDYTENVLDVLSKAGVSVLWRDNNTGSQGVATRVEYERFNEADKNSVCDEVECRDIGMLGGLDDYIAKQDGDILIVLHQMGSHGPAYFKRYPKEYDVFSPACNSKELGSCTNEEIINAYDNSILYTDAFLNAVINFLEIQQDRYETSMIYMSDHGESLGESGVYLHGMPYFVAPKAQTHIPFVVWAGDSSDINMDKLLLTVDEPRSHDELSRLLLEMFEITSDDSLIASNTSIFPMKLESEEK